MAGQANDSERLPWLEPYREPEAAPRKAKAKARKSPASVAAPEAAAPAVKATRSAAAPARGGVPLAAWLATGVVVVALAAGGGYWAGHRSAPESATSAPTVTIPVAKVDPIPMPEVTEAAPAATGAVARDAAPARKPKPVRHAVSRRRPSGTEAPPRPDAAPPLPKVMSVRFSPPPSAGQAGSVVDLGRYLSPGLADSAYRVTVSRYPYLGGLAKVVAPQPVVYGQPRLYALQLGAKSPREARQLCDNLKKIGRPCVVR